MCIYIWSCIQLMDFDLGRDICCIRTRPRTVVGLGHQAGRCEFGHQSGSIFEHIRMDTVMFSHPIFFFLQIAECVVMLFSLIIHKLDCLYCKIT